MLPEGKSNQSHSRPIQDLKARFPNAVNAPASRKLLASIRDVFPCLIVNEPREAGPSKVCSTLRSDENPISDMGRKSVAK